MAGALFFVISPWILGQIGWNFLLPFFYYKSFAKNKNNNNAKIDQINSCGKKIYDVKTIIFVILSIFSIPGEGSGGRIHPTFNIQ
jgi:hypothetical protein